MRAVPLVTLVGGLPVGMSGAAQAALREIAHSSMRTYEALFEAAEVAPEQVRAMAEQAQWSLRAWAPDLAEEIEAGADFFGLAQWQMYARNARTEIIALGPRTQMTECSTVGRLPDGSRGVVAAQTWDWHADLADAWHVAAHPSSPVPFVSMTEVGMLAKSGINAHGVGVLLNMMHHASDGTAASDQPVVPVHSVLRRVLDTATTVSAARHIIASTPLGASSCLTVVGPSEVDCLEASPAGVASVAATHGWIAHTNHFLDPDLAPGDTRERARQTTPARLSAAWERIGRLGADEVRCDRDVLADILQCHDDGAPICRHSTPDIAFADRWSTLSTVVLEPDLRRMSVAAGGPCTATASAWVTVTP